MSNRILKFIVKFFNRDVEEHLSTIEKFWKDCSQPKFKSQLEPIEIRRIKHNFNYEEAEFEVYITIRCSDVRKNSDIETYVADICKRWCSQANYNEFFYWLYFERNDIIPSRYISTEENLKLFEFAFGTIPNVSTFVSHYQFHEKNAISNLICSFYHTQQYFKFCITNTHKKTCEASEPLAHKFVINYSSISRIFVNVCPDLQNAEIFFHLHHVPFLFKKKKSNRETSSEKSPFPAPQTASAMENWLDKWERTFEHGCLCNFTRCTTKRIARSTVLKITTPDKYRFRLLIECLTYRCPKKVEIFYASLKTTSLSSSVKNFKSFPWNLNPKNYPFRVSKIDRFNCEYAWLSLHSKSGVISDQVHLIEKNGNSNYSSKLLKDIFDCAAKNPKAVAAALFTLGEMINKNLIFNFQSAFMYEFNNFGNRAELCNLPQGMCYVRRLIITPSKIIFLPPFEHFDNRIIREYGPEFMIRVSVQDDNFSKLTYAVQRNSCCNDILKDVVGMPLIVGFHVGSRHYQVLASSNSQLRDHGMWLYAEDPAGNTATSIQRWMGDFRKMTTAAKLMARMGQCFSSSEEASQLSLDHSNEIHLKDMLVSHPNRTYNFSDGVGTISSSLAEEVRMSLEKNSIASIGANIAYKSSAFQIRYKGCKGMVAEDPKLQGRAIGIRPSMMKFPCSTSSKLEVVKASAPCKLFLNKHLVTILDQMGVASGIFLKLQRDMMLRLTGSLIDEEEAAATLKHSLPLEIAYNDLQEAGVALTDEPFFRLLLLALFKSSAEKLLSHVRIAIPEKYGRNMLGIIDETRTLQYGQVFVQYSESTTVPVSPLKILKGTVLVTKNPSLHPGDVRKLVAVDVPSLHHLKDCIVFPSHGHRPHTDEISGSDLDGDEFVVLWYEDLIYTRKNAEPMDYPSYPEEKYSKEIKMPHDIVGFFCNYIKNDNIGQFAHAHLVWADKARKGIFSKQCMDIAQSYPYVLDFAKNGFTTVLYPSQKPDQYPDFMQKGCHANCYRSRKTLGLLYRASRHLEACSSKIVLEARVSSVDSHLEYPGWEAYEKSAMKHRDEYVNKVSTILNRYGMVSEAEAFTGCAELVLIEKWRNEKMNALSIMRSYISSIMHDYRQIFFKEVEIETLQEELCKSENMERKLRRASAWYVVLYRDKETKILSFPWVIGDVLAEVRVKNLQRKGIPVQMATSMFCDDIDGDIKACIESGILKRSEESGCNCVTLVTDVLFHWLEESELNRGISENEKCCESCFLRIVLHFYESTGIHCCSAMTKNGCTCSTACSPTQVILKFLNFYLEKVYKCIGNCLGGCTGFLPFTLQVLALQTLANLAITYDLRYLGVSSYTARTNKMSFISPFDDNVMAMGGDPIRISIKTESLKGIIGNYMEEVKTYLQKYSGVKKVFLHPEKDAFENCYMIVNSVGRSWQRFKLEELLLDVELSSKLSETIKVSL